MKTSVAIAIFLLEVGRTAAAPAVSPLPLECERLISCLTEITKLPVLDNIFGAPGLESASTNDICNDFVLLFGGDAGVTAICGAAISMTQMKELPQTAADDVEIALEMGQLKPKDEVDCPVKPFGIKYPAGPDTDTPSYDILIKGLFGEGFDGNKTKGGFGIDIESLYLFGGVDERSDANAYSALFIGTIAARAAQVLAEACGDLIPVVCAAAKIVADIAVVATEATVETINIHDGLIDGAEIQAAYENTVTIISQNCNLQADSDMDSLKLSIEPTMGSGTAFLVLSAERGVEKGIDLVIDCFDEGDEMYRTQPFSRTEISEGTTLVKFPKSEKKAKNNKSEKGSKGGGKGKGGCDKIRRFKGTAKKKSRSGVRSVRTVLHRTD